MRNMRRKRLNYVMRQLPNASNTHCVNYEKYLVHNTSMTQKQVQYSKLSKASGTQSIGYATSQVQKASITRKVILYEVRKASGKLHYAQCQTKANQKISYAKRHNSR